MFARRMGALSALMAVMVATLGTFPEQVRKGERQERMRNTPNRRAPGARMANIRAARKAHNVKRHRAAGRG